VNGQTAALSGNFSQGAWVTFPISVAAGETVRVVVDRTAGANAVLSASSSRCGRATVDRIDERPTGQLGRRVRLRGL